jgi:hypothetical protein
VLQSIRPNQNDMQLERYMNLTLKFLLTLILSCCAALAYADPPARAGRLNYVNGTVSFAPGQAPDTWAIATLNRPLATGDRLWTDRDGYAELHVGSTAIRLAPRTNLDILALDDNTVQLRLAQGDINVRVREVADNAVEIDTPSGAVLLEESGSYRISALASDDATNVIVHSGRAQVLSQQSAFSVRANQQVTLRGPDGVPSEIIAANVDAFDRWSADLDRREDRVASTRYVSPQMTGYEDLDSYGTWRTMPEYGAVWVPAVAAGWAPYRYGHWVWIEPWGWSWVDDAPWGFAPFHYGRWVWLHNHWAWAPGPRIARPVYAPALVAFVGGSQWSVSVGSGPAVGWFPLGWREPFLPWYRTSPTYVRNVNVTHVNNITVYNNVTRVNYVNQAVPQAVTVVPREAFVSARPVARSAVNVSADQATRAPQLRTTPAEPTQTSLVAQRANTRPPETATRREVFATRTPPARVESQNLAAPSTDVRRNEGHRAAVESRAPRVRVIERQQGDADASVRQRRGNASVESTPRASTPETRPPQTDAKPQANAVPQRQQDAESGPRAAENAAPQTPGDAKRDERQAATPGQEARPRGKPERDASAERSPNRAQPQAQPDMQGEKRAPGPPAATRPQPKEPEPRAAEREPVRPKPGPRAAEREPVRPKPEPRAAEREPSRPEPQARPPARDDREMQRERRSPPAQSRQQRPEASQPSQPSPRTEAPRPPHPAMQQAPRPPQPQAQAPRPEARGPQNAEPSPRAGGRPDREQKKNRND